jgi:hypothetical protein
VTLYWKNGKVATTDGPYAETKEQLAGLLILEARDLNHAIQLISQHPGMKLGTNEIRPVADLSEIKKESERDGERTLHAEDGLTEKRSVSWPRSLGGIHACQLGGVR